MAREFHSIKELLDSPDEFPNASDDFFKQLLTVLNNDNEPLQYRIEEILAQFLTEKKEVASLSQKASTILAKYEKELLGFVFIAGSVKNIPSDSKLYEPITNINKIVEFHYALLSLIGTAKQRLSTQTLREKVLAQPEKTLIPRLQRDNLEQFVRYNPFLGKSCEIDVPLLLAIYETLLAMLPTFAPHLEKCQARIILSSRLSLSREIFINLIKSLIEPIAVVPQSAYQDLNIAITPELSHVFLNHLNKFENSNLADTSMATKILGYLGEITLALKALKNPQDNRLLFPSLVGLYNSLVIDSKASFFEKRKLKIDNSSNSIIKESSFLDNALPFMRQVGLPIILACSVILVGLLISPFAGIGVALIGGFALLTISENHTHTLVSATEIIEKHYPAPKITNAQKALEKTIGKNPNTQPPTLSQNAMPAEPEPSLPQNAIKAELSTHPEKAEEPEFITPESTPQHSAAASPV